LPGRRVVQLSCLPQTANTDHATPIQSPTMPQRCRGEEEAAGLMATSDRTSYSEEGLRASSSPPTTHDDGAIPALAPDTSNEGECVLWFAVCPALLAACLLAASLCPARLSSRFMQSCNVSHSGPHPLPSSNLHSQPTHSCHTITVTTTTSGVQGRLRGGRV